MPHSWYSFPLGHSNTSVSVEQILIMYTSNISVKECSHCFYYRLENQKVYRQCPTYPKFYEKQSYAVPSCQLKHTVLHKHSHNRTTELIPFRLILNAYCVILRSLTIAFGFTFFHCLKIVFIALAATVDELLTLLRGRVVKVAREIGFTRTGLGR